MAGERQRAALLANALNNARGENVLDEENEIVALINDYFLDGDNEIKKSSSDSESDDEPASCLQLDPSEGVDFDDEEETPLVDASLPDYQIEINVLQPDIHKLKVDSFDCEWSIGAAKVAKTEGEVSTSSGPGHAKLGCIRQFMEDELLTRRLDIFENYNEVDKDNIIMAVLASTPMNNGVVELITEAETLRKIQALSGVTGSFMDRAISHWLQTHNPTQLEYNKAVENFMYSCAGFRDKLPGLFPLVTWSNFSTRSVACLSVCL
ncbi:hypothetical protein ACOMHN_037324 [Nucella lapillus]